MNRDPADFRHPDRAFAADGSPNPWYYEMAEPGYNLRTPDILCALAQSQLGKLSRFVARRRVLAARYDERLGRLAPLVRPVANVDWSDHARHLYVVHIDFAAAGIDRAAAMNALRARGIGTQVHYLPVHPHPSYPHPLGATSEHH